MYPLKDSQHVKASLVELDAKGQPTSTALDSPAIWSSSDESVAKVTASEDGLSADVTPVALGTAQVLVAAVIGGKSFQGAADVQVTPGDAVSLSIAFGKAEDLETQSGAQ